jgi:hypothetical protein
VLYAARTRRGAWRLRAAAVAVALLGAAPPCAVQRQPVMLDVVVRDRAGNVPDSLAPSDVVVSIDGHTRPVGGIRRVSRGPGALADATARLTAAASGGVALAEPSRIMVVAVDEASLTAGGERQAVQAATLLLDRFSINDRVVVVRLPLASGPIGVPATDRAAQRDVIARVAGRRAPDELAVDGITPDSRHIPGNPMGARHATQEPERPTPSQAGATFDAGGSPSADVLDSLRQLMTALGSLPGRKSVFFLSAGLDDRRPDHAAAVARAAVDARAVVYALGLHADPDRRYSPLDPGLLGQLAPATGGVATTLGSNPARVIESVLAGLSLCFELTLDPLPGDPVEHTRPVRVETPRPGLFVRAPAYISFRSTPSSDVVVRTTPPVAPQPSAPGDYRGTGVLTEPVAQPTDARRPSAEQDQLVARLAEYAAGYVGQYSAVVAEESYQQTVTGSHTRRRLRSDVLFIRSEPGREWVSFRDVFDVDGTAVRDRDRRLQDLFLRPHPQSRGQLQRIKDESARYNLGPIERNINVPLYPLKVLLPAHRGRFTFSLGRARSVGDLKVREVRFVEQTGPTLVQDGDGHGVPIDGRFVVDDATGAIIETTVSAALSNYSVSITVRYSRHARLGLWVPDEMKESYWVPVRSSGRGDERVIVMEGTARYSNFRRFQVSTDEHLSVPR